MDRRNFLKRFGIGATAAVVAPAIVKAALPELTDTVTLGDVDSPADFTQEGNSDHIRQYPLHPDECYISQWDEFREREEMRKHWPELVKRYGEKVSIFDFLNVMS